MRKLAIGKDWGLYVWNADAAQHNLLRPTCMTCMTLVWLVWLYENTHAVNGTDCSDERNLLLGDSSVFASSYPTIIYSSRCQIFSVSPFKFKFLQITCLFCNCKALQLPAAMKVLIITSIPLKLQLQRRFYGLKTCAGQWSPRSVDTGALFMLHVHTL